MQNITYQELIERFGQKTAFALLCIIEHSAHVALDAVPFDRAVRLQNAFDKMDREALAA